MLSSYTSFSEITRKILADIELQVRKEEADEKAAKQSEDLKTQHELSQRLKEDLAKANHDVKFHQDQIKHHAIYQWLFIHVYQIINHNQRLQTNKLIEVMDFCRHFKSWHSYKERNIYILDALIYIWNDTFKKSTPFWHSFFRIVNSYNLFIAKLNANPKEYQFIRSIAQLLAYIQQYKMIGNVGSDYIANNINLAQLVIIKTNKDLPITKMQDLYLPPLPSPR